MANDEAVFLSDNRRNKSGLWSLGAFPHNQNSPEGRSSIVRVSVMGAGG